MEDLMKEWLQEIESNPEKNWQDHIANGGYGSLSSQGI
jgi:hypothetical protein